MIRYRRHIRHLIRLNLLLIRREFTLRAFLLFFLFLAFLSYLWQEFQDAPFFFSGLGLLILATIDQDQLSKITFIKCSIFGIDLSLIIIAKNIAFFIIALTCIFFLNIIFWYSNYNFWLIVKSNHFFILTYFLLTLIRNYLFVFNSLSKERTPFSQLLLDSFSVGFASVPYVISQWVLGISAMFIFIFVFTIWYATCAYHMPILINKKYFEILE